MSEAAGILFICPPTERVLLALRSESVEDGNTWNLFGGGVEEGEDTEDAARREAKEEAGFDGPVKLRYISENRSEDFSYFHYAGYVMKEFTPKLNYEHSDAQWFSLEEAMSLPNLHWGVKKMFSEVDRNDIPFPGRQRRSKVAAMIQDAQYEQKQMFRWNPDANWKNNKRWSICLFHRENSNCLRNREKTEVGPVPPDDYAPCEKCFPRLSNPNYLTKFPWHWGDDRRPMKESTVNRFTGLFEKRSEFEVLKANKTSLNSEEKDYAKENNATWSDGGIGVWKSKDSSGKTKYVCHTHRAYRVADTLAKACKEFQFIKTTA